MHLKLKISPVIVLVGFMGCGKTTVGRLLAERLGWQFVDLDDEIERRSGMEIVEIFEREGEPKFRELEHEALLEQMRQARQGRPRVLALGGGAFAEQRNREQLEIGGLAVWLDCPVETLWDRVCSEPRRPLARRRDEFERLYHERRAHYERADFTLPDTGRPHEIVNAILKLPLF
jgi:shikimate kinase